MYVTADRDGAFLEGGVVSSALAKRLQHHGPLEAIGADIPLAAHLIPLAVLLWPEESWSIGQLSESKAEGGGPNAPDRTAVAHLPPPVACTSSGFQSSHPGWVWSQDHW